MCLDQHRPVPDERSSMRQTPDEHAGDHRGECGTEVTIAGEGARTMAAMRALVLIGVLAGLLVAAAGCGSDEPSLCGSLEDLQSSVQQLQEVELEEGAVDDLRSAADEIEGNVAAVRDAAGEQLGDEAAELEDSARALAAELEAATEGEVTAETRQALLDSASRAVAAFDALREAAPECDL